MTGIERHAIPGNLLDRVLDIERRLDDLEGFAPLPVVDPIEEGGTIPPWDNGEYLLLDTSNDPLTNSLTIIGNLNLNASAAELQIEGDHALSLEDSVGTRTNVMLGSEALSGSVTSYSVIAGHQAAYDTNPANSTIIGAGAAHEGHQIGFGTGPDISVIIGHYAGYRAEILAECVLIGERAGAQRNTIENADIQSSVIIGLRAASDIDRARYAAVFGTRAHAQTSGDGNVAIGHDALYQAGAGTGYDVEWSVAVGYSALYGVTVGAGNWSWGNVAIGDSAGSGATDPVKDVFVGADAGRGSDTVESVLIGYSAGRNLTRDKTLIIENSNDIVTPLIYGEFDNDLVRIHGTLAVTGGLGLHDLAVDPADPADGQMVMWVSDGTGSGDAGDVMMKITVGATTKTVTLVDFSAA